MSARRIVSGLACAALIAALVPAHAAGVALDDEALSGVWGQALLDLTNTSQGGYDFSRITLNADITLSANLKNLKLGTYTYAPRNGTGSDIDLGALQFGISNGTDAQRTVDILNPYFEWVYANDSTAATRQVVGMRLGFGGITGDIGLQMNTVSGSLLITTPSGVVNSANDTALNGKRWDGLAGCASCTIALSSIGGVVAGDPTAGPSRDFFISLLKTALTWPTTNAALAAPAPSQSGFWLNWTDRLAAINTTGQMPPNVPKTGP